jgi:peptidoglycan hydrolase CwlO-like protein
MSIPQRSKLLLSLRQWKAKAITRREQLEALNKRLGELILSRDSWKRKAQADHATMTELQATVHRLQTEVVSLQTHVTDYQAECRDLRTQVTELQAENRRLTPSVKAGKKTGTCPLSA